MIVKLREFAWLPKRLTNGKLIWLKPYCAYYDVIYKAGYVVPNDTNTSFEMIEVAAWHIKDCK